jgi:hypothetical protein
MDEAAVTRSELKDELSAFQIRLREDAERRDARLREDAEHRDARMLDHIERIRLGLSEQNEKTETTLLREFRKWAISFESRFKANDTLVVGFNERLISVEERLSDLERK